MEKIGLQVGLKASWSNCKKVTQFGAASDACWISFSLIFMIKPCNAWFILFDLDLFIGPPIPFKGSPDGLFASLSFPTSSKGFVLESDPLPGLKDGGNRKENFGKSVDPSLLEVLCFESENTKNSSLFTFWFGWDCSSTRSVLLFARFDLAFASYLLLFLLSHFSC